VIVQTVWQKCFDFLPAKSIVVTPLEESLTCDAGLLPIRQLDERLGFTARFVAALRDGRSQRQISHPLCEMTRSRIYGVLAGYEDQNDHDALRSDPVFKLIAGRLPDDPDLASQPTLSRFENGVSIASLFGLRDVLIDHFIASFAEPPLRLTLDIDTFDDPTHGQQQLTFFHGFYDQHQYLPRVITCAQNDLVVMVCLLYGTAHPTLGVDDDLEYLARRLREAWPDVQLELRADSGFGTPNMYEVCERLRIRYTIALGMNDVFERQSAALLAHAHAEYTRTGQPQRLFCSFPHRARRWPKERRLVIKVEVNAEGSNRRAVVTDRPGALLLPGAVYEEYADRGESENRNKELKRGLAADRLSDHRYMANLFRLYLHVAAQHLLVRMRRLVAAPPRPPRVEPDLPLEARQPRDKRRYFNRRRQQDPLGEGEACTWRMQLIKVAARVRQTARRVVIELSGCWPYLNEYARTSDRVLGFTPGLPLRPG
jgi:hypothetical protein